ncbi:PKD domain-containing protein [Paraflavisolibacter sp. H34]|uniref:PKD domain-containing protein n=1 Tax=Huijunlia imazamoxiresistens TaxID=3127457 RepID=UPI00301803BE
MKKTFTLVFLCLFFLPAFASHIVGGEMTYTYTGPGAGTALRYRITLRLYRDERCTDCAPMPGSVFIGIFNNDTRLQVPANALTLYHDVPKATESLLPITGYPACIANPPQVKFQEATYTFFVDLPENQEGYTAAYQTCCRIAPLANVVNVIGQGGGTGSTYACQVPGKKMLNTGYNSSPQFATGLSILCKGRPFTLDFSAQDPDATDSLVYYFCDAYDRGIARGANNQNPGPPSGSTPPQYETVRYHNGFTGTSPLGAGVTIDEATGIISGIAPANGRYVICVGINEYRHGKLIGYHRKDFIVTIDDCDFAGARLPEALVHCDGREVTLQNQHLSAQNRTYYWDAGPAGTSQQPVPTFRFPDTGTYTVKLVVNRGEDCRDSTTTQVKLYPGFTAQFEVAAACAGQPTLFTDASKTAFGEINYWSWDFGEGNSPAMGGGRKNAVHTYNAQGTYKARLVAGTSKGCRDTVYREVAVAGKPPLRVQFTDTLIAKGESVQLTAYGIGLFRWTPQTYLENGHTATPVVSPQQTTTYLVQLNDKGCLNTATVLVKVITGARIDVPNAFTPNKDGRNDLFRPITEGLAQLEYFRVFNRWGQLVYQTTTLGDGWNGSFKGREQPNDTYVWSVKATDLNGKQHFQKGTVVLIR